MYCGPDLSKTDLVGISTATLQQWLLDSQQALHDLITGGKPVSVTYVQGDGQKMVTYTKANIGNLRGYIAELKTQLGITNGRRPFRPVFSR